MILQGEWKILIVSNNLSVLNQVSTSTTFKSKLCQKVDKLNIPNISLKVYIFLTFKNDWSDMFHTANT